METEALQSSLAALMGNPALMEKLRAIAGGLSLTDTDNAPAAPPTPPPKPSPSRRRLLEALRPYLQEKRREKLDMMLGLLGFLELAEQSGMLTSFLETVQKKPQEVTDDVSPNT